MAGDKPIVGSPADLATLAAQATAHASAARDYAGKVGDLAEEVRKLRLVVEANNRGARRWRALLIVVTLVVAFAGVWLISERQELDTIRATAVVTCTARNEGALVLRDILEDALEEARMTSIQDDPLRPRRVDFLRRSIDRIVLVDCFDPLERR